MKLIIEEGINISNKEREAIEAFKELLLSYMQPHSLSMERSRVSEIVVSKTEVAFKVKCLFNKANTYVRLGWLFRQTILKDKDIQRHSDFTNNGFVLHINRQSLI